MIKNIQKNYEELFKHSCYAFCLCYKFSDTKNEWVWLEYIAKGVQNGYITEDCYVEKPVLFINSILDSSEYAKNYKKDVAKVTINSIADIPNEPTIVEMECPTGGSHFVVCHYDGNKVVLDFDPSGVSNSWVAQKFISWRKYL